MKPVELTPEERKARGQDQFAEYKLEPDHSRDVYVGDPVQCPRCGKGWITPGSELPCTACELKALRGRVKELEEALTKIGSIATGPRPAAMVMVKTLEVIKNTARGVLHD